MAVVIETTLGDITVDLYLEQRPATCLNFLKLCKMKYYNFNLFHTIRSGFIAQTGDPSGEGSGGESIWGLLEGGSKRFFSGEKMPKIRHTDAGLLSMVCTDNMMVGSQFFFTLAPDLDSLDGVHCVIGEVTEGHEVLTKLNEVICDETHRPYQDVRITHTVILEDPFNDLSGMRAPSRSPSPNAERLKGGRIAPDEELDETQGKSHEEIQEIIEEKEAKARATILEIVGDLPDADVAPPENVLFVCKLNPVTTDDDLEIIFSRFGKIVSCEVIRDKKTADSLQYAFIEFEDKKSCEEAYFKMDNVLIDDRRIHVDFSQSVSKMRWLGKGRGVQYFNEKEPKRPEAVNNRSKRSHSREKDHSRRQYEKDRELRNRDHKNRMTEKSTNNHRRDSSRSRSQRDTSKNINTRSERTKRNHSEDRISHKHKVNDSNKRMYDNSHGSSERSNVKPKSTTKHNRKEQSRSPIRKEKENVDRKQINKREKSNERHSSNSHKVSKRHARGESDEKERKSHSHSSSRKCSDSKKNSKSNGETFDARQNIRSPSVEKKKLKLRNEKIIKTKKIKNNMGKNKKRKPSTSSDSETSESSSSSSESTSSSGGDRKKHILGRKKSHHSSSSSSSTSSTSSTSSSSTSSTDSTSSSSSSSTDSSISTSESDGHVKKFKKNNNKKSGKKTKKL